MFGVRRRLVIDGRDIHAKVPKKRPFFSQAGINCGAGGVGLVSQDHHRGTPHTTGVGGELVTFGL